MQKLSFRELPLAARIATMLSFFTLWVLFFEFVIDRHGLDASLPYYRVGVLCPYDLLFVSFLALLWVRAHRRQPA